MSTDSLICFQICEHKYKLLVQSPCCASCPNDECSHSRSVLGYDATKTLGLEYDEPPRFKSLRRLCMVPFECKSQFLSAVPLGKLYPGADYLWEHNIVELRHRHKMFKYVSTQGYALFFPTAIDKKYNFFEGGGEGRL